MIKQAVILCGGEGTRLRDSFRYTPAVETPKPLIEVGGRPFLEYAIRQFVAIGVTDIVLIVQYMPHLYRNFLIDRELSRCVTLIQTNQGTSIDEGLLSSGLSLNSPFILLNGDCLPIMARADLLALVRSDIGLVVTKWVGRDAGMAVVFPTDIVDKVVSGANLLGMLDHYKEFMVQGGLHIGTIAGLQRARTYMDIVMHGQ